MVLGSRQTLVVRRPSNVLTAADPDALKVLGGADEEGDIAVRIRERAKPRRGAKSD